MASCVKNISTKNYRNVVIRFQFTVENVGDVFLGRSVVLYTLSGKKSTVFSTYL